MRYLLLSLVLLLNGCGPHKPIHVRACRAVGIVPLHCDMFYTREFPDRTEVVCESKLVVNGKVRRATQVFTYKCVTKEESQ